MVVPCSGYAYNEYFDLTTLEDCKDGTKQLSTVDFKRKSRYPCLFPSLLFLIKGDRRIDQSDEYLS